MASFGGYPSFETLKISAAGPHILHVELNRPEKLNAMNLTFWEEIQTFFELAAFDHETRCILVSGAGRGFSAGLDLQSLAFVGATDPVDEGDVARHALRIRRTAKAWQDAFSGIERCGKPVIACLHGPVVGAGLEMVSACDIRMCTQDAYFVAAEVDIGIAADVGGLQRFPKVVGNQSLVKELVFSARKMEADEAFKHGFVSQLFKDKTEMFSKAGELAKLIASKSPVALLGVKELLNYSRDHGVEDSLDYAITWNMAMLQGKDVQTSAAAKLMKKTPVYLNLPAAKPRSKL